MNKGSVPFIPPPLSLPLSHAILRKVRHHRHAIAHKNVE